MSQLPESGQRLRVRTEQLGPEYWPTRLLNTTLELEENRESNQEDAPFRLAGLVDAEGLPENWPVGTELWVEYQMADGTMRMFRTRLVAVTEAPYQWVVLRPSPNDIIRQQRREFVRVDVSMPVRLEIQRPGGSRQFDVYSRDISGGGLGLWVSPDVRCTPGDVVKCYFSLPNNNFPVEAECRVIRLGERNHAGVAPLSLQFHGLREAVRQKIVQYTFQRQRYLSKLGELGK